MRGMASSLRRQRQKEWGSIVAFRDALQHRDPRRDTWHRGRGLTLRNDERQPTARIPRLENAGRLSEDIGHVFSRAHPDDLAELPHRRWLPRGEIPKQIGFRLGHADPSRTIAMITTSHPQARAVPVTFPLE